MEPYMQISICKVLAKYLIIGFCEWPMNDQNQSSIPKLMCLYIFQVLLFVFRSLKKRRRKQMCVSMR